MNEPLNNRGIASENSGPLTAQQTAIIIEKLAGLYSVPGVSNERVAVALRAAAKIIATQRGSNFAQLTAKNVKASESRKKDINHYASLSIRQVHDMIDNPKITKSSLIDMAFIRFGMSKSRLAKLSIDDAVNAIDAAAANEESLEIIAKNADQSGRYRKS